jgi:lipopolysaccharide biosynthesis regulator YciM
MKFLRLSCTLLIAAGLTAAAFAQQGMRPEVGKPLQQASDMLKAGKAKEALAKVREADAVPNKTPAEQLTIERMRGAAAQRAGDTPSALKAFHTVYDKTSGAEQAQAAEALAFAYSQAKDWEKTSEWARKAQQLGGNSAQLRQLIAYVQSQSGDYAAIARDSAAAVAAAEQAGRKPGEDDLLRLADAYQRMNNQAQYAATLEKLVLHYPKKDYWNAYLARIQRKPGFADRLGLDVMRLKLANGLLTSANDYMEMAQLALQAGLPFEGKQIVEQGFKAGALGTGPEAERHQRLKALADKQAAEASAALAQEAAEAAQAKDGNALVKVGYAYATMGQADKGVPLIEQGIAKGGLKRPDEAKLRLGMAQVKAGAKARGVQTLRTVGGKDGTADIARLWITHFNSQG